VEWGVSVCGIACNFVVVHVIRGWIVHHHGVCSVYYLYFRPCVRLSCVEWLLAVACQNPAAVGAMCVEARGQRLRIWQEPNQHCLSWAVALLGTLPCLVYYGLPLGSRLAQ
jgi:hypothetical protein